MLSAFFLLLLLARRSPAILRTPVDFSHPADPLLASEIRTIHVQYAQMITFEDDSF